MLKTKPLKVFFVVMIFVTLTWVVVQQYLDTRLASYCQQYPSEPSCLVQTNAPVYKDITSFSGPGGGAACSKPLRAASYTKNKFTGERVNFYPVNKDEAALFCHNTYAIEYKGKLTVLQKPEVLELINKYSYKDVSIKALEFKYIEDRQFVHRLLPQYANREIGCIIVIETPNEKLVYLEDEDLETFEIMEYAVFQKNLGSVSTQDRQIFSDNLK
jgi:hypothetical protein